jgi:hypothetical protein
MFNFIALIFVTMLWIRSQWGSLDPDPDPDPGGLKASPGGLRRINKGGFFGFFFLCTVR